VLLIRQGILFSLRQFVRIFYSEKHLLHDPQQDWEVAERGVRIFSTLVSAQIGEIVAPTDWGIGPITAVHSPDMVAFLKTAYSQMQLETSAVTGISNGSSAAVPNCFAVRHLNGHVPNTIWGKLGHFCTDSTTPILPSTWTSAYWSAQTALSAAHHVYQCGGNAYALCRPPGHHAYPDLYGGYCYLNNAAIAANWLTQQQKRVAIIDVDYHHGNGTQAIFYARGDVMFCSIHADPDQEYPYYCGFAHEKGDSEGYGLSINYPLPVGTTGRTYLKTVQRAINEIIQFDPDILLISLGVDTTAGDPNGGFLLNTNDFTLMGQTFSKLAMPKVIVQEGGYLLESIGNNVLAFLQGVRQGSL
jgi:acetoin utilization deacetylase AcuC-like enzyme